MTTKNGTAKRSYATRSLRLGDIPALLDLERRQWTAEQSATADDFRARIEACPDLCVGAFCTRTGELLASLFCKPTTEAEWARPGDWTQSSQLPSADACRTPTQCLFGISLTSVDPDAALQLIAFKYLYAIKLGIRKVFLGSPMPGLKRYLERHPDASVEGYARSTRSKLPMDPQLRYYHRKGFQQIVCIREDYFPHEASLDYAAILKSDIGFAWLWPLFRIVPISLLRSIAALAPRFAIPEAKASSGRLQWQE